MSPRSLPDTSHASRSCQLTRLVSIFATQMENERTPTAAEGVKTARARKERQDSALREGGREGLRAQSLVGLEVETIHHLPPETVGPCPRLALGPRELIAGPAELACYHVTSISPHLTSSQHFSLLVQPGWPTVFQTPDLDVR